MKYIVDIKGEIEGDYEIIGKYEEEPLIVNLTDEDIETLKRLMEDCKPHILYEDTIGVIEVKSQNKLAKEVWELYEKYHPYLATRVYEFGEELKELLHKYQKGA